MNRIKLFLKLLSLTLFIFLSACTQTQPLVPTDIPQPTTKPYSKIDKIIENLDMETKEGYSYAVNVLNTMYETGNHDLNPKEVKVLLYFSISMYDIYTNGFVNELGLL